MVGGKGGTGIYYTLTTELVHTSLSQAGITGSETEDQGSKEDPNAGRKLCPETQFLLLQMQALNICPSSLFPLSESSICFPGRRASTAMFCSKK